MDTLDNADNESRYLLVGNIIDKHLYGEKHEIKSGTKHFRPGAKVFLFPEYGGMGHMHIPIIGLPRKSRKKIEIVIRSNMIKNVRVKKTYDPKLIQKINESYFYKYFEGQPGPLQSLAEFAEGLNKDHVEIDR